MRILRFWLEQATVSAVFFHVWRASIGRPKYPSDFRARAFTTDDTALPVPLAMNASGNDAGFEQLFPQVLGLGQPGDVLLQPFDLWPSQRTASITVTQTAVLIGRRGNDRGIRWPLPQ